MSGLIIIYNNLRPADKYCTHFIKAENVFIQYGIPIELKPLYT